ncbi:MAG: DUF1800 domain-containing protein [Chloroherpetonaceae bacterium]|nr:DUF1800 domain-containing protein [Chloroherpetonaceae bacterium]
MKIVALFLFIVAFFATKESLASNYPNFSSRKVGLITPSRKSEFPYQKAGITEREAAAHLLSRFTFGVRKNEVDEVLKIGLDQWFEAQMNPKSEPKGLDSVLSEMKSLSLEVDEIAVQYVQLGKLLREAYKKGILKEEDVAQIDRKKLREKLIPFAKENGYKLETELLEELSAQKLFRAVYSNNQLHEVLTDFWFNHFNVSYTKGQARGYVYHYEREAIRPFVLKDFQSMLFATAKHPAMLLYLDNAQSLAPDCAETLMMYKVNEIRRNPRMKAFLPQIEAGLENQRRFQEELEAKLPEIVKNNRPRRGINENYARELMELHTLGVDGGYSQKDVVEVARALTGWTLYPLGKRAEQIERRIERGKNVGFVRDGNFLFRSDTHDAGEKVILGKKFEKGGGLEEGEAVLTMLAHHPSTAKHIAKKLAIRFISDNPSEETILALSKSFEKNNGNLKELTRAILLTDEFWAEAKKKSKIKSPFEYAVSAIRGSGAELKNPIPTLRWIAQMGQQIYAYSAPTGFPDRAEAWVNSGSLINRMNFATNLTRAKIRGVSLDYETFTEGKEPESLEAALRQYAEVLLPSRKTEETIKLLIPILSRPDFEEKLKNYSEEIPKPVKSMQVADSMSSSGEISDEMREFALIEKINADDESQTLEVQKKKAMEKKNKKPRGESKPIMNSTYEETARILALIIGSPEFQRR